MPNKNSKKLSFRIGNVAKDFTEELLSLYSGISSVSDYIGFHNIGSLINRWFATTQRSATVFSTAQILLSVILSSMSGVHRLCHIEKFTADPLIKKLLNLRRHIDEDTIKKRFLQLGQSGAVRFHELTLGLVKKQLSKSNLSKITIDCDSSVFTVYGHQQGAEKGYNPHKKGAASYHPLLCFDAKFLHSLYGERAESENWIEQVKNHLYAGQTITGDFWVNDLLWQLSVVGYNLSVMMRYEADVKVWRQEHTTFMRWFIQVPAKVVTSGRKTVIKLSKHYHHAGKWRDFEQRLRAVC